MRQITYTGKGRVEEWDVPDPAVSDPRDAIVEPVAVSTCDVDAWIVEGRTPFQPPIALGHEAIGRVRDLGGAVRRLKIGDLVAIPWHICCGECIRCRDGQPANCASVPPLAAFGFGAATGSWGGALSDRLRIPFADYMLVPLEEDLDPVALASLGDNLCDAWRTVGPQLAAAPAADVLVVGGGGGGGSIGLYAAALAKGLEAASVVLIDPDGDRRRRAAKLGIATAPEPGDPEPRFAITVDASGDPVLLRHAIACTAPEGVCTSAGIYFRPHELPLFQMYTLGITFRTGRCHARAHMPTVLDLVRESLFDPAIAVTQVIPWDDAVHALQDPAGKLVFVR